MNLDSEKKMRLAIFASGGGSNAQNCLKYFAHHPEITIPLIVTNNPKSAVIGIAEKFDVPCVIITNKEWQTPDYGLEVLRSYQIDFILLAGYLALLPADLIKQFPHRIFNLHPALLPDFGGKGMYGKHVHQAVYDNKCSETGITVHEVDEVYDEGKILFQIAIDLIDSDTPESIEKKVRELEVNYLPGIVEKLLLNFG